MASNTDIVFREFDFSKKPDLKTDLLHTIQDASKSSVAQKDEQLRWIWQPSIDYIDAMCAAAEDPTDVVLHNFTMAPEMIYAMGLKPFCPEALSVLCPTEYLVPYIDESHKVFVPDHICSFLSAAVGMAISDAIPKPAAIVHTSQPCDNILAQSNALADYYGVDVFTLDSPYSDNDEAYEYYARQIKEGFKYLEEMTGKKMDIDRFREVMERSQRAHELLWEINELKKRKPCPIPTSAILRQASVAMYGQTGSEEPLRWLEKHLEDAKERASKGIGGQIEEKIRTAWIYAWPSFDWSIYDWLGQKFGAIAVIFQASEYFYRGRNASDMDFDELCKSLAIRNLTCPMARSSRGHMDTFVRDAVYWCREWDIDAAIFAGHLQCQVNWSVAQITKEVLMEELGVPLLSFVVDALDPRVTSTEKMARYIEPFLEMVAENKGDN